MTPEQQQNIKEFREAGLLWAINTFLHMFGWAIFVEMVDGQIRSMYPKRTLFRGFTEECNNRGYANIALYMKENSEILLKEAMEEPEGK